MNTRFATTTTTCLGMALTGLLLGGCPGGQPPATGGEVAVAITNRIDVPPAVVENLGITYAPARRAKLERWLTVTGELEVAGDRTHELRAPAAGRVRLTAARWQSLEAGALVARLESPALGAAQAEVANAMAAALEAESAVDRVEAQRPARLALATARQRAAATAKSRLDGLRGLLESARALDGRCQARLKSIRELASSSSVASKQLHDAERERHEAQEKLLDAHHAVAEGEVALRQSELDAAAATVAAKGIAKLRDAAEHRSSAATLKVQSALQALSALTGISAKELAGDGSGSARWQSLTALELRAPAAGTLERLGVADGRWVEAGDTLGTVIDATELRFHGRCPEDDLEHIPAGAEVRIQVALAGRAPITTTLVWPPRIADPVARTVLLEAVVPNGGATPLPRGLSATASVLIGRSEMAEVLIPADAVTRDGLETLVFRLNPENNGQVIRTPVTLGARNKEWVEVISGVSAKDQLVISGVQQLKQTGAGKGKAGGHFHADGTYHDKPH
jgi:multidrug efflux pump subunit AcrA (membrane-fusion protein)